MVISVNDQATAAVATSSAGSIVSIVIMILILANAIYFIVNLIQLLRAKINKKDATPYYKGLLISVVAALVIAGVMFGIGLLAKMTS